MIVWVLVGSGLFRTNPNGLDSLPTELSLTLWVPMLLYCSTRVISVLFLAEEKRLDNVIGRPRLGFLLYFKTLRCNNPERIGVAQ